MLSLPHVAKYNIIVIIRDFYDLLIAFVCVSKLVCVLGCLAFPQCS